MSYQGHLDCINDVAVHSDYDKFTSTYVKEAKLFAYTNEQRNIGIFFMHYTESESTRPLNT